MGEVIICLKPERISAEEITLLLHRSYQRHLTHNLRFAAASQSVQTTEKIMSRGKTLVALDDEKLVGTVTVIGHFQDRGAEYGVDNCASIHMLAVDPQYQGQKISRKLLDISETVFSEATSLVCDTAIDAVGLVDYYHKLGFQTIRYLNWGMTNYVSVVLKRNIRRSDDRMLKENAYAVHPIGVFVTNMPQFYAVKPLLKAMNENGIEYDIYVPRGNANDSSGWKQLWHNTFQQLQLHGYSPMYSDVCCKYRIILAPQYDQMVSKGDYTIRFRYSVVTKPQWAYKLENILPFDYVLCYSKKEEAMFGAYTRCCLTGEVRAFGFEGKSIKNSLKTIVYAPTYGCEFATKEIADKLSSLTKNYRVILKIHPGSDFLKENSKEINILKNSCSAYFDGDKDLFELLKETDLLLSDYSGAIFDAMAVNIPVALLRGEKSEQEKTIDDSILEQFVLDGIVPCAYKDDDLSIIVEKAMTYEFAEKQRIAANEVFSITPSEGINNFIHLVKNLLECRENRDYREGRRRLWQDVYKLNVDFQLEQQKYLLQAEKMKEQQHKIGKLESRINELEKTVIDLEEETKNKEEQKKHINNKLQLSYNENKQLEKKLHEEIQNIEQQVRRTEELQVEKMNFKKKEIEYNKVIEQLKIEISEKNCKIDQIQKNLTTSEEKNKRITIEIQTLLSSIKAEFASQKYWLDLTSQSKPYRAAHFAMRVKHDFFGRKEDRELFWKWLKGDRSFISKYNYLGQVQNLWDKIDQMLHGTIHKGEEQIALINTEMLNGYEYKFYRFLKKRMAQFNLKFSNIGFYAEKGLVSVILPVYNGEDLIEESIRSILQQTYHKFELIIVDDGSNDNTPYILDKASKKDKRIRVIHQKNAKLPQALNNGFALARGEYLTWTSADNNMHKDCLGKLVGYMQNNPDLAMCYANIRVIDAKGQPITSNTWYSRGEHTGNVYLPNATLRLNTYPENTIAAAFMYRYAVPKLIGGYDPYLYTVEDYDYWMRINDFFNIKHTDFDDAIYDYRFHDNSLTSKAKELRINEIREKTMIMEDFRQDWIIRPMCWVFRGNYNKDKWKKFVEDAGHIDLNYEEVLSLSWPNLGSCIVQVVFAAEYEQVKLIDPVTPDAIRVLVRRGTPQTSDDCRFDFMIQIDERLSSPTEGWLQAVDERTAFELIQIYSKAKWFSQLLKKHRESEESKLKATIVLCTYKRVDKAQNALHAMIQQDFNNHDYEVLVVNNDPQNRSMKEIVNQLVQSKENDVQIRYIDCPYSGLSAARNFSVYEAYGEILLFVDDDGIMDRKCLRRIVEAFDCHKDAAVVGGQILLNAPERFSNVILPGYESIWSERRYAQKEYATVEQDYDFPYGCNYAVRRQVVRELGGFRIAYGRIGKDFSGGEEMVLSHLALRMGWKVGIEPRAIVIHDVDPSRYTLEHVRQTIRASRLTNRIMKMDLYKPFDLGMQEEKDMLQRANEKMTKFEKNNLPKNDLHYIYTQYEIEATQETISMGESDMKVMSKEICFREQR